MNLPARPFNQRQTAETALFRAACLGFAAECSNVDFAETRALSVPFSGQQNHTSSPLGQQGKFAALLPSFLGGDCPLAAIVPGEKTKPSAPGMEPCAAFRVVCADTSRQGTEKCPSNPLLQRSSCAPALLPAVTRLPNRALLAPLSAQVRRQSPAAAFCKGRPSARLATLPIANSIRANADPSTDLTFTAHSARRTRFNHPAQQPLSRGIRVSLKTLKDTPCSKKS